MAANSAFTRMLSSRTRFETSASLSARSRAAIFRFMQRMATRMYSARGIRSRSAKRPLSSSNSSGSFRAIDRMDISWRYSTMKAQCESRAEPSPHRTWYSSNSPARVVHRRSRGTADSRRQGPGGALSIRVYPCAENESALHLLRGGVLAGEEAPDHAPGDAVLAESTGGLARAVEARYHLAPEVLHLEVRVDAQPGAGIVRNRRGPGGVERRRLDFVLGFGFVEIGV